MSRKANPVTIGIFVSGAGALLVGLLIFLGTFTLLNRPEKFILFFDESVNGLNVGSAVKFKGVPIGEVTRIMIRADNQPLSSSAIPVIIELDETRLEKQLNVGMSIRDENAFADQIAGGLRAKLNTESLITGLLFIELDYVENPGPPRIIQETFVYKEIPTIPSTTQELTRQAMEAIATLSQMDFAGTIKSVKDLLDTSREKIAQVDVPRLMDSVTGAADSVQELAASLELEATIAKVNQALDDISSLAKEVESEVSGTREELSDSLEILNQTLADASDTLETLNRTFQEDSRLMLETELMLQRVSQAAVALRGLAEYLERNPRALITGRAKQND